MVKKILIIEDTASIREELSLILTLEGFLVIEATNGKEGIKLIEEKMPDLILCDVYMPGIDGYEVYKKLMENRNTRNIPFIFLTSMIREEDMKSLLKIEPTGYLIKPFDTEELLELTHKSISVNFSKLMRAA
jgi:CheY-like chemotaxis protein